MIKIYDVSYARITDKTIEKMHEMVKRAKMDYQFINLIRWIVRKCAPKDAICEIKTIYSKFKPIIRYVFDPYQVELVQSVWQTLKNRAGDCDDLGCFIGAAVGAIGYPYRFITIKGDPQRPDEWSHIWTEVNVKGRWIPLDLSVKQAFVGWKPEGFSEKVWKEPIYISQAISRAIA